MNAERVRFATKFWYGFGQVSEGIKNFAYQLFLLYFYNQVLGVSAMGVGTVLLIALIFDAVTDPLIGSVSDSLQSRWGRRHGFMYASAIPMGISFYFVFAPPDGLGPTGLLLWLFVWGVLSRAAMTLYHVPHMALGAELSSDYHQRTKIVAYRIFFGFIGGSLMIALARGVFLPSTPEHAVGQSNPAGYAPMGLWMGALMTVAMLASALGTHDRIPYLAQRGHDTPPFSVGRLLREIREALRNRSFRAFFFGLLLYTIGRGTDMALWLYVGTFFFKLGTNTQLVPLVGLVGVVLGSPLWPLLRLDKRTVFMWGITGYAALTMGLPIFKLIGVFPAETSPLYAPIIFGVSFLAAFFGAAPLVAGGSMVADISDEHELTTGRRQEGIFFGALAFAIKAAAGVGNWLGALALTAIAFPTQVKDPTAVDPWTVTKLALIYGPVVLVVVSIGIAIVRGYALTRERHTDIQRTLAERRQAARASTGGSPEAASPSAH